MSVAIDLSNKIALVTGASRGLGAAIARRLHEAGAFVYLNYPDAPGDEPKTAVQALVDELNRVRNDSAAAIGADVSNASSVQSMMGSIVMMSEGLDLLVNNAGILRDRTIAKMTVNEWHEVIEVNLNGVFYGCKYGLEIMRDGGAIVNLGSLSADAGFIGQANYSASKAGVQALTRVLSREVAKRGIRVNALAPGVIDTEMVKTIPDEIRAGMIKNVPLRRLGEPNEVADAALFLCSPLASYITGHTLKIDGGWRG